jgi:soluble lytic murein transglycosylase-like protein
LEGAHLTQNFNNRTLLLRHKIALGATCSILLLTFSSVTRYEQEKKSIVLINTANVSQPTQAEPAALLTQYATPEQSTAPTKVPAQKARTLLPTAAPRQATSTPIPAQTASTAVPVQTTPQVTPTRTPEQMTKNAYISLARSDATKVGINPNYFVHQIQLESNFNPNAQSPSGAIGISQFMPETASGLGIDPADPIASLNAAARLMANLAHQFGDDYAKALAAYNLGSESVKDAEQVGGKNWLVQLPVSTQNYIHTVMD